MEGVIKDKRLEDKPRDLDFELSSLIKDYKTRYPDLVEPIAKSINASFSQLDDAQVSVSIIVN